MWLPALLGLFALAPAQESAAQGCRKCSHRGVVECGRHHKEVRELGAGLACSALVDCSACGGTLLADCLRCDGGPESAAVAARRKELAAWQTAGRPMGALLGRPLLRVDSKRFQLIGDFDSLKGWGRKGESLVFLLGLAADLEKMAAQVDSHYQAKDTDYSAKMRLWFWGRKEDHVEAMQTFLFHGSQGDFSLLGKDPIFSVWTADEVFGASAETLHSLAIHQAAHMLVSNLFTEKWVGDAGGGWLDAGAGHWYETFFLGRSVHFCIDEAAEPPSYGTGVWWSPIRKLLARAEGLLLPTLLSKPTGVMSEEEHALAWSFYDYLVHFNPDKMQALLKGLKAGQKPRQLFAEVLSMDVLAVEREWRQFVDDTYPFTNPKPKRR